jgi:uncharacterized protein YbjT (DUF2867 family)
MKILVIGATGSIGLEVVDYAIAQGHDVRAVVRKSSSTKYLNESAEIYLADITKTDELVGAVKDIDAVVFTHGVPSPTPATSESVNYGAVQNVLDALQGKKVAIALMTAIGVTTRQSSYNKSSQSGEWKLRSERLVRASGNHYTIVRPGWFDYQPASDNKFWLAQGDTRAHLNPSEIGVARVHIAKVLVEALSSKAANGKTFELYDQTGQEQSSLETEFAALKPDQKSDSDGPLDNAGLPYDEEPTRVKEALSRIGSYSK